MKPYIELKQILESAETDMRSIILAIFWKPPNRDIEHMKNKYKKSNNSSEKQQCLRLKKIHWMELIVD